MRNSQIIVKDFNEGYGLDIAPELRALDLASEVGELSKEILLGTNYGRTNFKKTDNFENELGDATGIDLEACLTKTINKMDSRHSQIKEAL